jgi:Ser/Thr protein kinase RdoA (MazF antagonist)
LKSFLESTPRQRALRLRQLALNALQFYALDASEVKLISYEVNGIFLVRTAGGERWILRVCSPESGHTRNHLAVEMGWLSALARETRIRVPRPLAARDGSWVVEAEAAGVPEPRLCVVFSWVPGVNLAERMTLENMQRLGELSARLHEHALTYAPPGGLQLNQYDSPFPFGNSVVLFDEKHSHLISKELQNLCRQAIVWVQDAILKLKASDEPMRIIHTDLHQWNVRVWRNSLAPIDFEDLMLGWPVQDIAISLYYSQTSPEFPELRKAFRQGYERAQPWPEKYPGEIDAFLAARGLDMFNFALQSKEITGLDLHAFATRLERRLRSFPALR